MLSITSCVSSPPDALENIENTKNEKITEEDYAVYSFLIKKMVIRESSSNKSINISNQIPFESPVFGSPSQSETFDNHEYVQKLKELYPKVDEDTLVNFMKKQTPQVKLQSKFDLPIQYNLIDGKEIIEKLISELKSVISFSQVGFNKTKTQAFVRIECFCGISAFGSYVLLEKQNGDWQIKYEFNRWIT